MSTTPDASRHAAAHILIVEDNAHLAFGLQRTLEAQGHRVRIATTGREAIEAVQQERPALMILDLMIPEPDGYAVLEDVRARGFAAPVLILSARSEEGDKVRGFRAGADDFVTKPFGVLELIERVHALLRRRGDGTIHAEPALVTVGAVTVDVTGRRAWRDGVAVSFAPLEFALLVAFMRHPGEVLSRATLLRDVWGHAPDIQTRTVDLHIAELRRKIEWVPAEPRHIVTVYKAGYRYDP